MGGGAPIFSYIFRFGALFLVQNFRKVIHLGVGRFVDIFFFFGGGGGGGSLRNRIELFFFFFFFFWGGGGGGGSFLYINRAF